MIEEGRGKLEWERKIPDEKLSELKDMLSSADFKANMPKVIKRIYELSWDMFGDLPRGHHKNNSMHKLASKVKHIDTESKKVWSKKPNENPPRP